MSTDESSNQMLPYGDGAAVKMLNICRAAADRQINAMDPEIRERVSRACNECGLSAESTFWALSTTCDLIYFHHIGRHAVLTTAQRFDALAEIHELASALADALDKLPFMEKMDLMGGVSKVRKQLDELDRLRSEHNGIPNALGVRVLSDAARMMLESRAADKGKGGRLRILAEYGEHLEGLAETFEEAGLPVGRGGMFERFCEVVFDVAGIPSKPEGAIRWMLQHRMKTLASIERLTHVGPYVGVTRGVSEFLCVKRGNESVTSLSLWAPARAPQAPPVEACTHGSTTFTWRHFAPAA